MRLGKRKKKDDDDDELLLSGGGSRGDLDMLDGDTGNYFYGNSVLGDGEGGTMMMSY